MKPEPKQTAGRIPWLAIILLLGSIYLFWLLPKQLGPRPVQVDFQASEDSP